MSEFFEKPPMQGFLKLDYVIWDCLHPDPSQRPTIDQLAEIEWISSVPELPTPQVAEEIRHILSLP
jgi:hypothetical protein